MRLPFYHWYAVPPLVLLAIGAGLACRRRRPRGRRRRAIRWWPAASARRPAGTVARRVVIAAIVAVVAVRPLAAIAFDTRAWFPDPASGPYIAIGEWLARPDAADATVGYIEVGFVGYHARRRIVDPFGLVTPGVAAAIARRDFLHAYRTHRPDVILHSPVYSRPRSGASYASRGSAASTAPSRRWTAAAAIRSPCGAVDATRSPAATARAAGSASTPRRR